MTLDVRTLKPFRNDSGMSVTVNSDRRADDIRELPSLERALNEYYELNFAGAQLQTPPRAVDDRGENAYLYSVKNRGAYVGSVKVTPKGARSWVTDRCVNEDYPISVPTAYVETFWLNFFPAERTPTARRHHRDGFVRRLDPSGNKTKLPR